MTTERYDGEHGIHGRCPDDGTCHHYGCHDGCFRVRTCGPLSGVYPDDEWPDEVLVANNLPARSAVALSPEAEAEWWRVLADRLDRTLVAPAGTALAGRAFMVGELDEW